MTGCQEQPGINVGEGFIGAARVSKSSDKFCLMCCLVFPRGLIKLQVTEMMICAPCLS